MGLIERYYDLGDASDVAKGIALWHLDTYGEFCGGAIDEDGGEIMIDTINGRVCVMVMGETERDRMVGNEERHGYTWLTRDERKLIAERRAAERGGAA